LRPSDISSELIDAELTAASCGDPDLLILMAAPAWKSVERQTRGGAGHAVRGRRSSSARRRRSDVRLMDKMEDLEEDEGYASGGGAGGDVCLMGYPPWQVRLTEIL